MIEFDELVLAVLTEPQLSKSSDIEVVIEYAQMTLDWQEYGSTTPHSDVVASEELTIYRQGAQLPLGIVPGMTCSSRKAMCGEFVVRSSFTVIARDTFVVGYVESGEVRTGDELRWIDGDTTRHATCRDVEGMYQVALHEPPSIAIALDNGAPQDFIGGVTLSVYR